MFKKIALLALLSVSGVSQAALVAGDIAFTSFNADEDGLSFVSFVDIEANTTIYFSDNEWTGSAFNTGESYNQWTSGASTIAAGTVIRFSAYDKSTLSASQGTLSRVSVPSNTNWGISNSNETIYAYLGSGVGSPTTFLTAITNGSFAIDGSLTGTGLTEGVNAMRLNANTPSATPDYAEYTGARSGLNNFEDYKAVVANVNNWNIDTTNGTYTSTVPNTTAFTVAAVPEPESYALFIAGLGLIGAVARRQSK